MVQQNQFGGQPTEDPNLHLEVFLEFCETLKYNGVTADSIRLRLFPFSLRDKARAWLYSLPQDYFTTWDQLEYKFLSQYFPPSKTANLRHQITNFVQKDGESLFEAWDRFKGLLQQCPHHGLERWLIIHTFYNGISYSTKSSLDSAAGGALMNKTLDEAFDVIESVAQNHHQWATERGVPTKSPGKYEVNNIDLLAAKLDALTHKFEQFNVSAVSNASCEICGMIGHSALNCQIGMTTPTGTQMEQVDAINNFNQRPNPYSSTYNPGWRNHPNFSYQNNQGGQNNFGASMNFQGGQKSNLETMIEKFITAQTQQNDKFHHQHKETAEAIRQLTVKVDSLANHTKMLETQIAQVASTSSRTPGRFSGNPEENPVEHCNAITLRSGKILDGDHRNQHGPAVSQSTPVLDTEAVHREEHGLPVSKGTAVPDLIERDRAEHGPPVFINTPVPSPEANPKSAVVEDSEMMERVRTYKPPIPFPQRLEKGKLDEQFGKFLEMLRKIYINIPFTEALRQMPTYSKFLKDILTNKRKLEENATVALTEECSALIQNKRPPKLKDPGSFSIPCKVSSTNFDNAYCDLGASVNLIPLSVCNKLELRDMKLTTMALRLADRSIRYPNGILEDVPVQVGDFTVPTDFVVLEMDEDPCIPIILGRPFLATAGAVIDVKNHKLSLTIGSNKIEFDLSKAIKQPLVEKVCYRVEEDHDPPPKTGKKRKFQPSTYDHVNPYKEQPTRWHDQREFHQGDLVLLFNSRLKFFSDEGKSRWTGPFRVRRVYPNGAVDIWSEASGTFKVNGQRLKTYFPCETIEKGGKKDLLDPSNR